jgi:RNA polymerase sigma factor (sigma-70 family)
LSSNPLCRVASIHGHASSTLTEPRHVANLLPVRSAIPCGAVPNDRIGAEANVAQRELVERAGEGDNDAFDALVGATIARLDAAARLILRDPDRAKDAVQEAYARAWRDLPGLRDPDRFDAWLHRLLVRACYDDLRRRRRRPIEIEITPLANPSIPDVQSGWADRDLLERAMRTLQPDLRTVVVLFYYLDMSIPTAAEALGVPVGTVKSRLHRARQELRAALGGAEEARRPALVENRA